MTRPTRPLNDEYAQVLKSPMQDQLARVAAEQNAERIQQVTVQVVVLATECEVRDGPDREAKRTVQLPRLSSSQQATGVPLGALLSKQFNERRPTVAG